MKLDESSLAESPILARLVTDAAIDKSGALELLSDGYQPPHAPMFRFSKVEDEEDEEDEDEVEGDPTGEEPVEIDAEGYPAIIKVAPVAQPTPPRGVKLIRPRTLADINEAS